MLATLDLVVLVGLAVFFGIVVLGGLGGLVGLVLDVVRGPRSVKIRIRDACGTYGRRV
jgi:hypothetical protein